MLLRVVRVVGGVENVLLETVVPDDTVVETSDVVEERVFADSPPKKLSDKERDELGLGEDETVPAAEGKKHKVTVGVDVWLTSEEADAVVAAEEESVEV